MPSKRDPLRLALNNTRLPFVLGVIGKTGSGKNRVVREILEHYKNVKSFVPSYFVFDVRDTILQANILVMLRTLKALRVRVFLLASKFTLFPPVIRDELTHVLSMESDLLGKFFVVRPDPVGENRKRIELVCIETFPRQTRKLKR